MPTTVDLSCLRSTLKNVSGVTKRISLLPPHGRELANNEEITIAGNAVDAIARLRGARGVATFEKLLRTDVLELVNTPAPIVYDQGLGHSYTLGIQSGAVTLRDPCWENSI